ASSCLVFCFFSSRRRHTRSKRDWSSDVCSSDLRSVTRRSCGEGAPRLNCGSDLCRPCPTGRTARARRAVRRPDTGAGTALAHLPSGGADGASRPARTRRRDGARPGADMRAHEAGALHGNDAAPTWLPYPQDVNHLIDGLWSRNTARNAAGAVEIAGVDVHRIAEEVGTPAFVLDEDDFRHRARSFRDAFAEAFAAHRGADVYYAGKA